MAILNFPKMCDCELALRSVVGRRSVVNIHITLISLLIFRYVIRNVAREEYWSKNY